MNAEELEALPPLTVVLDDSGRAWQRCTASSYSPAYGWEIAGAHCNEEDCGSETSQALAECGPHIVLAPATDSDAERLAVMRKAVTG